MNSLLLQYGYAPAIFKVEEKAAYLDALELSDAKQSFLPLEEFVAQKVSEVLEMELRAAQGLPIEEPEDYDKKIDLLRQELTQNTKKPDIASFSQEYQDALVFEDFLPMADSLFQELKEKYTGLFSFFNKSYFIIEEDKSLLSDYPIDPRGYEDELVFHYNEWFPEPGAGLLIEFDLKQLAKLQASFTYFIKFVINEGYAALEIKWAKKHLGKEHIYDTPIFKRAVFPPERITKEESQDLKTTVLNHLYETILDLKEEHS